MTKQRTKAAPDIHCPDGALCSRARCPLYDSGACIASGEHVDVVDGDIACKPALWQTGGIV